MVDIHAPAEGLGNRLTEMVEWCIELAGSEWEVHGNLVGLADHASFYFSNHDVAEGFRERWLGDSN